MIFFIVGVPVITPSIVTVATGESATFSCSAEGDPAPQITWYRGSTNQINVTTLPRVIVTGVSLMISSITLSDEDYYTCRAVFETTETESQAFLNVICKYNASVNVDLCSAIRINWKPLCLHSSSNM